MNLETLGYALLGLVAAAWLVAMLAGLVAAFPYGLIGLVLLTGVGLLLLKVVRERLRNKEDDYYADKVEK